MTVMTSPGPSGGTVSEDRLCWYSDTRSLAWNHLRMDLVVSSDETTRTSGLCGTGATVVAGATLVAGATGATVVVGAAVVVDAAIGAVVVDNVGGA